MLLAAAPPAAAPLAPDFARGCYDRAKTTAEQTFCANGERGLKEEDPEELACLDRDSSQQAMNRCAGDAYQRADEALNAQWKRVLDAFEDAKGRKLLVESQRAWLKYRSTHCDLAASDSIGGSMWPMLNSGCLASLTRQRTRELKELIDGTE
jgi:uncharacterized protein YecT (DUF1311 family)